MTALLRNREFVRLFLGRLVTNAGDSLYYIAAMWLVYELTGSELYTGLAGFLVLAPQTLQFLAGPLVDRMSLRRLLVGTQVAQGLLVLVIPAAAVTGHLSVWLVLAVVPVLSLLNQPVYPAESAALPRIVEKDALVPANSLFAVAYQGVDAAFNALGGLLVAAVGAVTLFLVDSVTFAVAAMLFATLRIPAARSGSIATSETEPAVPIADGGQASYYADLRAGIEFVRGSLIARMLVGAALVNFAIGGALAVLPAYGDGFGGAGAYGFLAAAVGGGLLIGAVLASVLDRLPVGWFVVVGLAFSTAVWMVGLAADQLPVTVGLLALAFVPVGATNVFLISMVQALVPQDMLGRVMAVVMSAATVAMPVGSLLGGATAAVTSATVVMIATGVSFAVLASYVLAVPSLRRLPRVSEVETLTPA